MIVFIDTSVILALLSRNDINHKKATSAFVMLQHDDSTLVASNYILVESFALIHGAPRLKPWYHLLPSFAKAAEGIRLQVLRRHPPKLPRIHPRHMPCYSAKADRIGLPAVRSFQEDFLPLLTIHWVDHEIHNAAITGLLTANRRNLNKRLRLFKRLFTPTSQVLRFFMKKDNVN